MRILQVFGLFVITWYNQCATLTVAEMYIRRLACKNLESTTPLLRLKKYLFCNYDPDVRSNHHKIVTNVTMELMPKLMEFEDDKGTLSLHSWLKLMWTDAHLNWSTNLEYEGINFMHVKSYNIWVPDLHVYNSGDMSDQSELSLTECILFSSGSIVCVPPVKHVSKCNPDFTYWPYDKHKCVIKFGSWSYTGEEVDFHFSNNRINMDGYEHNSLWDFKFIDAVKQVVKYQCCPNDTFPVIEYTFLLTRHHGISHTSYITPAIALILLTITVLWLDSRSMERMTVASVNFICHLLCIFDLHWQLPYNGSTPPNIMLFYRESLALATFTLILTAVLRKMQDISAEMPSWISSTTMFILSNRAGRFLILNNEESKMTSGDIAAEENSDIPKSILMTKEPSWRHFAAIIEWLSFFCVILTYIIILAILVPMS